MTLFLHVARRALLAFLAALLAVVALYLVVDFAENATAFRGPGWLGAAAELYLWKSAVIVWQMAPAAMLLGASVTASALRRTREWVALRALGLGPWRLALPALAVAALSALALAAFDDALVVGASARVDEIMATRFGRSGSWYRWREPRRWFRGRDGRRVYHLQAGAGRGRFERVTVLELAGGFRLERRIDAARMAPGPDGAWVLEEVAERAFAPDGSMTLERAPQRSYRFDEDPEAFAVRPGRPGEMRRAVLAEQTALRRRLGLPVAEFELERHRKLAWPLAGFAALLCTLALALRRERKGHLTASLVEVVAISALFWAIQGVGWSLGLSGRLHPMVAAWAPDALFLLGGLLAFRRVG
ncbi:MAG TPA: LptF/LptG family permease [Anaeromyxobacteraceae bacterium]|nr:LptF/LptG family permease [Anaeromyxobacteraceae bacterium]